MFFVGIVGLVFYNLQNGTLQDKDLPLKQLTPILGPSKTSLGGQKPQTKSKSTLTYSNNMYQSSFENCLLLFKS